MSTIRVPALFGWAGKEEAKRAFDLIGHTFPHFFIAGQTQATDKQRVVLWDAAKRVNGGQHLPTYYQQIGDCVSMGMANAVNYLSCIQIMQGAAQKFRPAYQPYIYGTSRVQVGGGTLWGDGSLGSWAADSVRKYGVLWADENGVPPYSGQVAKRWGARPGPAQNFIDVAKKFLVGNCAPIKNYTQARDAICNGYPVTIASDRGFQMKLKVDRGKSWGVPSGTWNHQMVLIGVDDDPSRPGCYCLNSWGADAFGPPADDAPPGGFWVDAQVIDYITSQDCWAPSQFNGFPEQKLNFMLIGDSPASSEYDEDPGIGDPSNMLISSQSLKPQSAPFYRGPKRAVNVPFDSKAADAVPQKAKKKRASRARKK